MPPKTIRPETEILACAVCGRRLLQGETPETYLAGGSRRVVCELCTTRANHQGWIREAPGGALGGRPGTEGGLFDRLRARRGSRRPANGAEPQFDGDEGFAPAPAEPAPEPAPAPDPFANVEQPREPRHVHAVPTSGELKTAKALDLFNASEHRRTIAGVARSLGAPDVLVRPHPVEASLVVIVVAWELCWYRYEVDLAEEGVHGVRLAGQGYELAELPEEDLGANAAADDHGTLAFAA